MGRTRPAVEQSTERKVREAALHLFATKGFEGTGIRDIASETGVSSAALYHYMGTKEDLLVEIMRDGLRLLLTAADYVVQSTNDPVTRLAALVELHVWAHGIRQLSARVADTEVRSLTGVAREEILGLRDSYEAIWTQTITAGAAAGDFIVPEPRLATFALIEMCTGVSHWYSPGGRLSLREICGYFASWALAMVEARRDGQSISLDSLDRPDPAKFY